MDVNRGSKILSMTLQCGTIFSALDKSPTLNWCEVLLHGRL